MTRLSGPVPRGLGGTAVIHALAGGVLEEVLVVPIDALGGWQAIPAQRLSHACSDQAADVGCGVLIAQVQVPAGLNSKD